MLALIGSETTRLHAGSLALCVARLWGRAGLKVVLVDADTSGAALAQRLGDATRATYLPSERGVPSLMAARQPLTLRLLADHCYSLDASARDGSVWAAFAPSNIAGGACAAEWLSEHADDLVEIDRQRRVIVCGSLLLPTPGSCALLQAVSILVVVAPANTHEQLDEVLASLEAAGLDSVSGQHRLLISEGESSLPSTEIRSRSGFRLLGRLRLIEDDKVLRMQGGRRERAFVADLKEIAVRLHKVLVAISEHADGSTPDAGDTDYAALSAAEAPARDAAPSDDAALSSTEEPARDAAPSDDAALSTTEEPARDAAPSDDGSTADQGRKRRRGKDRKQKGLKRRRGDRKQEEELAETGPQEEELAETGPQEEELAETGPQEEELAETGPQEEELAETGPQEEELADRPTRKELADRTTPPARAETATSNQRLPLHSKTPMPKRT